MVFIDHLQEMSQQELAYLVLLVCDVFLSSHCDTTGNNYNTFFNFKLPRDFLHAWSKVHASLLLTHTHHSSTT